MGERDLQHGAVGPGEAVAEVVGAAAHCWEPVRAFVSGRGVGSMAGYDRCEGRGRSGPWGLLR